MFKEKLLTFTKQTNNLTNLKLGNEEARQVNGTEPNYILAKNSSARQKSGLVNHPSTFRPLYPSLIDAESRVVFFLFSFFFFVEMLIVVVAPKFLHAGGWRSLLPE